MNAQCTRPLVAGTALAVGLLALSGCSTSSSEAPTSTSAGSASTSVPQLSEGVLNLAVYPQYPPYEYIDENGELAGLEIDLANAIGAKLGVDVQFDQSTWDSIIPSVVNGRYDFGLGQFYSTPDREAQVDVFQWINITDKLVVKAGNPDDLDPAQLCGTTLAAVSASVELDTQKTLSAACEADGKPAITTVELTDTSLAIQAILSGRAQGFMLDPGVAKYYSEQNGDALEVVAEDIPSFDLIPAGWIFGNDSAELENAVQGAIADLVADGTWTELLTQYGVDTVAIVPPVVTAD